MSVLEALLARRSVRSFKPDLVPDETISELLNHALQSPSWCNVQPYKLACLQGEAKNRVRDKLCQKWDRAVEVRAMSKPKQIVTVMTEAVRPDGDFDVEFNQYPQNFRDRRASCGKGLYDTLGIERHDRVGRDAQTRANFEFFQAPVVFFLFVHESSREYGVLDAGIFLQSLMLSAQEMGLATCAQGSLATWRSPLEDEIDIPEGYKLLCGLSLGYASDAVVNQFNPGRVALDELMI